jgi:hypothetical protein
MHRAELSYYLSFLLDNITFQPSIVMNCLATELLELVRLVELIMSLVLSEYSILKSIQDRIQLVDSGF